MSNKIVPGVYRQVIDDVIQSIKHEFDAYGVSEEILAELSHKWQSKVVASRVADFEPQTQQQHTPATYPPQSTHQLHMMPQHPLIKPEMVERYAYSLPPLPGPQLNGVKQSPFPPTYGGILSFPPSVPTPHRPPSQQPQQQQQQQQQQHGAATTSKPAAGPSGQIPQADGPTSSDSESPSPPPSQSYAPRTTHPSLPEPVQASGGGQPGDSEAINSDLDDSDTEGEDDGEDSGQGDTDIVFCTYDKVGRVKNKWKCILKDGMIHINGKDYLFAKCTGEFEW